MEEKFYNVTNRSGGRVFYTVAEMNNLTREFGPGETKKISATELGYVNNMSGGRVLLYHFLRVDSAEGLEAIDLKPQPEYYMTEQDIIELLKNGSQDQFLDALDFAPEGVIELIKDLSVRLPLNDVAKREALLSKTGFDVAKAIENSRENEPASAPQRRIQDTTDAASGRRTQPPKFNIGAPGVSKEG